MVPLGLIPNAPGLFYNELAQNTPQRSDAS